MSFSAAFYLFNFGFKQKPIAMLCIGRRHLFWQCFFKGYSLKNLKYVQKLALATYFLALTLTGKIFLFYIEKYQGFIEFSNNNSKLRQEKIFSRPIWDIFDALIVNTRHLAIIVTFSIQECVLEQKAFIGIFFLSWKSLFFIKNLLFWT